uniref:Uncharacterized protein n=1 Tax=Chromera velia CCMP2878 TaxID=1169474 RepID=A0A0G4FMJ6_9ALVE|eukprot:Cvel_17801.t1-p1 / transcript=Cvel_17801.t1 / gene=Cvel_17801 / organism=Chromera_velia_CCMP2878 / gene_product=hypothetical protein / transcript_product=hypothetical protein / location=Cvel_scaffold1441:40393-40830(-) / protein_length=146 / sequence_SO=supercontig / SO=protein_coding / is_pseudo=false
MVTDFSIPVASLSELCGWKHHLRLPSSPPMYFEGHRCKQGRLQKVTPGHQFIRRFLLEPARVVHNRMPLLEIGGKGTGINEDGQEGSESCRQQHAAERNKGNKEERMQMDNPLQICRASEILRSDALPGRLGRLDRETHGQRNQSQ